MSENMVVLENSLNSLELSFNVKKKLIDEIKSPPTAAKKGQCIDIPRKVVDNIMRLLKANKAGIWLSRFQLEYKVRAWQVKTSPAKPLCVLCWLL